ncbi:hypothetical protein GH714_033131 [Hevea brasiliensis]|uniref:Serine/threonine-protein kinase ATR n=1 Tax=Hevea brasiliensis TaxID=3981 RepID=A0A6A6LR98_HEVBR|nr:hypothetical protein GH714_033131 [Hevea brasiliensis]
MQSSVAWLVIMRQQIELFLKPRLQVPNVHVEKAKLLWSTRRSDGAIAELQQALLHMPEKVLGSAARKRQEDNSELGPRLVPLASAVVSSANSEKRWWHYVPDVLLFYAKGLHKGHKNLFQALPRLLTLWFDFGSIYQRCSSSSGEDLKKVHEKVMSIMRGCLKDLPTYQWLTVLPQLVSRVCHQNEEIVKLVKRIITCVLRQYPQQALWIMAAVSKSTVPSRREAAAAIIQEAKKGFSQGNSGSNLFVQFASLIDHLIKLCFHPGQPKAKTINISTEFSSLKRMMPLGIIMPIQQSLTASLPTYNISLTDSLTSDIFSASDLPTISGISDEAEILSSLQRPKKIVLLGSDGIERPFLCKPKDDLRKDARMMEFNAMINRLLSKYPESRRRKLYVRTFAVIPLTEDCAAWFRARVAYAHTTAVWSMVGHIVGLGDRHGENILFDSTTGDCVHVDFSCLFDKGLQLEKPELVPFRLTQNMIDGMGITGYEGIFLRVCEITLSVLRAHRETLMSVLETFIHDPLVEWTKSHKSSGVEVQNPHAQRAINNIEARLQGVVVGVGAAPSLPLAVEGQARRLIAEAVSHKNLGKMYIWWMPWF